MAVNAKNLLSEMVLERLAIGAARKQQADQDDQDGGHDGHLGAHFLAALNRHFQAPESR